jgi:hypothetical protein
MVVDKQGRGALEIEVAAPGDVFVHVWEHPTNIELVEGDSRARKLDKKQLKTLQAKIKEISKLLSNGNYYKALEVIDKHTKRAQELELLLADEKPTPGFRRVEAVYDAIQKHKEHADKIYRKIGRLRQLALRLDRIQKRIAEHDIAIQNEKLYAKLREEMKKEVHFFASQCIERWSALGYRQEIHIKNKRVLKRVQFEKCVVTEDEIQFKIRVSDLTLLRSVKHHLPEGTRVAELVAEETLLELSAACQRPVTSPHNDENKDFSNGAFIVIHRMGMNDGLFNYIRLGDMLVKYNQGDRERFPFPIGVRRGRVAQFGYLDAQPHLMFNGITGSGKTNAIRSILTTFIQFHSPGELRLFITDLKRGADFSHFKGLPHMGAEIITEIADLEALLLQLVGMMRQRMDTIAGRGQFDIKAYNSSVHEDLRLERIIVVIDECGAIKSLGDKDQTKSIYRSLALLSTQARASGIHLFLGTQQSFADAIPGPVRDNITLVFSGKQRTLAASMGTFGDGRAKRLPNVAGRMNIYDGDDYMVQTPFASLEDIEHATNVASQWDTPAPMALPDVDPLMSASEFSEETVVAIALNELEGALKIVKIWEVFDNPDVSRNNVRDMVYKITQNPIYTHDGTTYKVVKQPGNFFKLIEVDSQLSSLPQIPDGELLENRLAS